MSTAESRPADLPDPDTITTREQATDVAVQWQASFADRSMSYGELADYQGYFEALAERFDLAEDYRENGII